MGLESILLSVFLILSCVTAECEGLVVLNGNDPGKCNQTNHGKQVLVQDRERNELTIVCIKNKNDVYQWLTTGGGNPVGEIFAPGYDCSEILDKNPLSKDGLYWIHLGLSYSIQVYCDMFTDGGGYMLFGKMNSSVTWDVPSDNIPVTPYGVPQWASYLGHAPILDFRVQIAKEEDLRKITAHWSLRLQAERQLQNLMIIDHGCAEATPGIGNIAYVKDLKTENIVTTNFRCSVFGSYHDPATGFGWNMMNRCLRKPCRRGFAFFDHELIKFQTDHSGSFSYSATGSLSGIYHNSTVFVGCDKKKCCGCFGAGGGTEDYCGTDCKKGNGGTVVKNVYTWFWVRSSLPKKVWSKCMDYKVTTENGDTVWYKLLDGNPTPEEGRCVRSKAMLNEGIVVVPDGKTARNVPAIPGILEYRKDTKELYVRANKSWNVVAQEKKIINTLNKKIEEMEKKFDRLNQSIGDKIRPVLSHFRLDISESTILEGQPKSFLKQLKQWFSFNKLTCCWRASWDGWSSYTFHQKCDNRGKTITLIKVGSYIFGGYSTIAWGGSSGSYRSSSSNYIFSLRNKDNLSPFTSPVYRYSGNAIYTYPGYGPTFGGGFDINIANNADKSTRSHTQFGHTYRPPSGYGYGSSNTKALLAGSYHFTPTEVEVYYFV